MDVKEFKRILFLLLLGGCFLGLMSVAVRKQKAIAGLELNPILTHANYLKCNNKKQNLGILLKQQHRRNKQTQKQLKQFLSKKKRAARRSKRNKRKNTAHRPPNYGEKSQMTAFLLCVMLGIFGAHRFYTGQIGWGIIHICSLGCCGVFVIIDMVLIILAKIKTNDGNDLIPW